jgi:predicted regulator of Ras-like GTPase activity (Roadblock/LC7/MglB family)
MFRESLETILERTEGATGALIMGMDGIAVEKLIRDEGRDSNMDVAATEITSLVRSSLRAGEHTGLGLLRELYVSFGSVHVLARMLSPEYFVVLTLGAEANLGRGRYELRKAELKLASEFAV